MCSTVTNRRKIQVVRSQPDRGTTFLNGDSAPKANQATPGCLFISDQSRHYYEQVVGGGSGLVGDLRFADQELTGNPGSHDAGQEHVRLVLFFGDRACTMLFIDRPDPQCTT